MHCSHCSKQTCARKTGHLYDESFRCTVLSQLFQMFFFRGAEYHAEEPKYRQHCSCVCVWACRYSPDPASPLHRSTSSAASLCRRHCGASDFLHCTGYMWSCRWESSRRHKARRCHWGCQHELSPVSHIHHAELSAGVGVSSRVLALLLSEGREPIGVQVNGTCLRAGIPKVWCVHPWGCASCL